MLRFLHPFAVVVPHVRRRFPTRWFSIVIATCVRTGVAGDIRERLLDDPVYRGRPAPSRDPLRLYPGLARDPRLFSEISASHSMAAYQARLSKKDRA